eukprot:940762-Lingulodinium_polyedra.AAC.1
MTLRSCFLSALRAMPAQVRSMRGTAARSAARWGTAAYVWPDHAGHSHQSVSDQTNDHVSVSGRGAPNAPG